MGFFVQESYGGIYTTWNVGAVTGLELCHYQIKSELAAIPSEKSFGLGKHERHRGRLTEWGDGNEAAGEHHCGQMQSHEAH